MKIYDCKRGLPPPYPISKPILNNAAYAANRTFVHPTPPQAQQSTSAKPVENALQTLSQMIGTVQPMAQPQQVFSIVKANSQAQNVLIHKVVSPSMSQSVAAPGKRQATIIAKDNTVTGKRVQQLALNGLVWMTTTSSGQTVQADNVHSINSATVMQAFNPVLAYQSQNVAHSSKMLISVSSANGTIPQISLDQQHLNFSQSQGSCTSSLGATANNLGKCNDPMQIQTTFGKVGTDQNQYKAPSALASAASVQLCQRNWPALTSCVSLPTLPSGTPASAPSSHGSLQVSDWTGPSALGPQPNAPNSWFSPPNSNGQKRMVLARVTPMSHDWKNLQQSPHTFQCTDTSSVKNLHVEDAQFHHKSSEQNRASENASSAPDKSVEKRNQTTPSSTTDKNAQGNIPLVPAVPSLTFKPSLYRQQNIHNIRFFYTPSTVNEHNIITSPVSSDVNVQHNVTSSGNHISTANVSSQNAIYAAPQLSPLSVGHCNLGVSPIDGSKTAIQQTVTTPAVEVGALYNNHDHSSPLPSNPPHSMNVLYSTVKLASKDVDKQTIQLVSSGSNSLPATVSSGSSLPSPVQLVSRGDFGKHNTPGLVFVIPPSMVVQNCQNMEAASICSPSTVLSQEKHMPVRPAEYQGETSNSVVAPENSKAALSSAASPSGWTGQQCEKLLGISSSTAGGFIEQQTDSVAAPLEPSQKTPIGVLSSSTELNGKKRNLILDTGILSKDSSIQNDLTPCDSQKNVTDSPPQKRFLASAVEDALKDINSCKNSPLLINKKINSSELVICRESLAKNEATIADQPIMRDDEVQSEICITGVFSLGNTTGLWRSAQQSSSCPLVDLTSSSAAEASDSSLKSTTGESNLKDKESHGDYNTLIAKESLELVSVPPPNLESGQRPPVKESAQMENTEAVLECSLKQNDSQLTPESNVVTANILIDLTGDRDNFTQPQLSESVLPSDPKEQDAKLVSDQNILPVEINNPSPFKFSDQETQDLDDLLRSIDTEIETLLNFWNPYATALAHGNTEKSACKHHNLREGEICKCKLPSVEEADRPDEGGKADLLEDADCHSPSYNIKVLGHTEILNLLAEISKPNERLPAESAWSETFSCSDVRLSEELQSKASQNVSSDGWKTSISKAPGMKLAGRQWGDQNHALLQSLGSKNGAAKKGKPREKKEYCCINAWLAASGVLGIYCHCKLSQGNKVENQVDLPNAVHETHDGNETSNPNSIVKQMEISTTSHTVPIATSEKHVLEVPESWNSVSASCTRIIPAHNQDEVMGEVQQEVCVVEAMQQHSGESGTRAAKNEVRLCNPGEAYLSSLDISKESDKLPCKVPLERNLSLKEMEKGKDASPDVVEIEPDKETWTVLEKELNEYKVKNVHVDPSLNVLSEEASDQTDLVKQPPGVKLGFKVMKRKPDASNCWSPQKQRKYDTQGKKTKSVKTVKRPSLQKNNHSPQKKTRYDVADAKLLPSYNCRIMIRDKTYSSSGERAVLVSLLPVSGKNCKTRAKARTKS
ncbi:uncharacterized protein LOC119955082 isoform X2 [Scyliorhinus canicula]|uniref:uncharacterized protein LOC119955082 isoform X2 n=1 Tax=Scyliorhinus canicula TaxID=7830 RepID=UPI0018F34F7D|nr:uncharacterized protein LOC119955082 isoform X2 [Scyliorhinus canicula]